MKKTYLCEEEKPKKLYISVSSRIRNNINNIYAFNQENFSSLSQWSEYLKNLENYISNPVIAFDYSNRLFHYPNGAIHLVEMGYDVTYITKTNNNGQVYVYIFKIDFKLNDFGLKDPELNEKLNHQQVYNLLCECYRKLEYKWKKGA